MDVLASPHDEETATDQDLNQADEELCVLFSIYGGDLSCLDDGGRNFTVRISPDHDASLLINLPTGYPSKESPVYTVIAPSLRGEARRILDEEIAVLVEDSLKQQSCVLYQLIEKTKEFFSTISVPKNVIFQQTPAVRSNKLEEFHPPEVVPEIFHGESFTERRSTFQVMVSLAQVMAF
jgi:RWD domain